MRTVRQHWFFWTAVVILAVSTTLWAWTAAQLQLGNSDQLVDGFLFQNSHTFHEASFPSTHTQFVKWPLFGLIHIVHYSPAIYIVLTLLVTMTSVAGFAYFLYRINRHRPLVVGAVYLVLAVVLAMVPAQVSGVTSPLNIALLTGRNVEYLMYIGSLVLLVRMPRRRSWHALTAVVILSLLMTSDQLFLYYGIVASSLTLLLAFGVEHVQLRRLSANWLFATLGAAIFAKLLLGAIGHGITHIVNSGPGYPYVHTGYGLVHGIEGAVQALGVNFGLTLRTGWLGVPGYVVSVCIVLAILWAAFGGMRHALISQKALDTPELLSVLLLMTTFGALVIFAAVNQPYLSNARYLGIGLFAGFVALATQLRQTELTIRQVYTVGGVLFVAICMAAVGGLQHTNATIAKNTLRQRDHVVAQLLTAHHESYLAGNYWRVFPIRMQTAGAKQDVLPLRGCLDPNTTLTSVVWQPDLRTQHFAYLLTTEPVGLPTPPCQKYLVEGQYGTPTSTAVISGTQRHPTEELLFYDNGASDRLQLRP